MVEVEESNVKKEAIEAKYAKRGRIVATGCLGGAVLAGIFMLSPLLNTSRPQTLSFKEYENAGATLYMLEEKLAHYKISYQTEKLIPYLNELFPESIKKAQSLEKAIELVKTDLKKMENTPEIKLYKKKERKMGYSVLGGFVAAVSLIGGLFGFNYIDYKKMGKELDALTNKSL